MTAWEDVKRQGQQAATIRLQGRDDLDLLESTVRSWIAETRNFDAVDGSSVAQHPSTSRLADFFEDAELPEVADRIRCLPEQEGPIHPGTWLFALLLGRANAAEMVEGLNGQEWRQARLWGHESFGAWDAYLDRIVSLLSSDEVSAHAAWTYLDRLVDEACADPGSHALLRADRTNGAIQALREYAAKPDIKEAWETRLDSCLRLRNAFFAKLMRRIDSQRSVRALARLPHPVFVEQAVDVEDSQADLHSLIRAAPIAFDEHATFLHEGMVVIVLLRAANVLVRRRAWNGSNAPVLYAMRDEIALEEATRCADAAIVSILDAVSSRKDAQSIFWAWLERLVFEASHRGYWRLDRRRGNGVALNAVMLLIRHMAGRLSLREDYQDWIHKRERLWQMDRVMACLAVALWGRGSSAQQIEDVLDWALLDQAFEFFGAADAAVRCDDIIGSIGAACCLSRRDSSDFFRSMWQRTRPLRERDWRSEQAASRRTNAAQLLALWGLRAFESSEGQTRQELESQVGTLLREAYQTELPSRRDDFWAQSLRRFAKAMEVGKDVDETERRITDFLRPFVRPDSLFIPLVVALADKPTDMGLIRRSLRTLDCDLDGMIQTFLDDEQMRIAANVYSRQWLQRVRGLHSSVPS